jgi:NADH:ubiquinone reductase (non-electrogenic)
LIPAQQLIEYTNSTFHHNHIDVMTRTSVKNVGPKNITATDGDKKEFEMPYGLLVWATGNTARSITKKLMNDLGEPQKGKRGLAVDDQMRVQGAENIWALGDCTQTAYSPTAQVAAQQGRYLARFFNQEGKRLRIEGALATPEAQHDPERIQKLQTELGKGWLGSWCTGTTS